MLMKFFFVFFVTCDTEKNYALLKEIEQGENKVSSGRMPLFGTYELLMNEHGVQVTAKLANSNG